MAMLCFPKGAPVMEASGIFQNFGEYFRVSRIVCYRVYRVPHRLKRPAV